MTKALKDLIKRAQDWSKEEQEELAEYAREIETRRTKIYVMSDEERVAVNKALEQARRGEFATDEEVEALWRKAGI